MKLKFPSLSTFDHPAVFILSMALVLIPVMAGLGILFNKLGWSGPAALVRSAAA